MKKTYLAPMSYVLKLLLFLVFFLLAVFLVFPNVAAHSANEIVVTTDSELRDAIEEGPDLIIVNDTIKSHFSHVIRRDVTIAGNGVIEITSDSRHFIVLQGATLTLEGNVTLRRIELGDESARGAAIPLGGGIDVSDGTFIMRGGTLRGNASQRTDDENDARGIVFVNESGVFRMYGGYIGNNMGSGVRVGGNSVFTMLGGEIRHNHGGVQVRDDGVFNMYDGTITLNWKGWMLSGGGVCVRSGSFHMHGGEISYNLAAFSGGGVFVSSGGFYMYGGEIKYNTGWMSGGGGVALHDFATFYMYDGIISTNAASFGGGVALRYSSKFVIYNGEISNNIAGDRGGGGIALRDESILLMYDGDILNNTAEYWGGGGISILNSSGAVHNGRISGNQAPKGGGVSLKGTVFCMFKMTSGEISDNTAEKGGGIYAFNPNMLAVGSDVIFRNNRADSNYNFGLSAGREHFPQIGWSGENSIPGTHLLNNYDINYIGSWIPAHWMIYLTTVALILFVKVILFIIFKIIDRRAKAGVAQ